MDASPALRFDREHGLRRGSGRHAGSRLLLRHEIRDRGSLRQPRNRSESAGYLSDGRRARSVPDELRDGGWDTVPRDRRLRRHGPWPTRPRCRPSIERARRPGQGRAGDRRCRCFGHAAQAPAPRHVHAGAREGETTTRGRRNRPVGSRHSKRGLRFRAHVHERGGRGAHAERTNLADRGSAGDLQRHQQIRTSGRQRKPSDRRRAVVGRTAPTRSPESDGSKGAAGSWRCWKANSTNR